MLIAHEWDEMTGGWSRPVLDRPDDCDPRRIINAMTEPGWEFEDSATCGTVLLITFRSEQSHLAMVVVERGPDHAKV